MLWELWHLSFQTHPDTVTTKAILPSLFPQSEQLQVFPTNREDIDMFFKDSRGSYDIDIKQDITRYYKILLVLDATEDAIVWHYISRGIKKEHEQQFNNYAESTCRTFSLRFSTPTPFKNDEKNIYSRNFKI